MIINIMRVACLFSGGKDSCFALFWAISQGFDPFIITVIPEEYSEMFHHPNINATSLQAKAIGIRQVWLDATDKNWHGKLKSILKKEKAEGIVTGAIASEFQRVRIDRVGEELGIPAYCPLWHKDDELMQEMIRFFDARVVAVSAEGIGPEFLGEPLKKLLEANKKNVHKFLEGGEGETFVLNAPFFKKPIKVKEWKKKWDGVRGVAELII